MELNKAKAIAAEYGINVKSRGFLISKPDSNPKVAKNMKFGILTAPLHLAPAKLSGFNVCAGASNGCIEACLHTAGNPAYMAGKTRARIAKTRLYFEQRAAFLVLLAEDIFHLGRTARRKNLKPGIRLNATSDIPWERIEIEPGESVIDYCKRQGVMPYDYSKIRKRAAGGAGYHITFSRTESNDADCLEVLRAGGNVAVVFDQLPDTWHGFKVIDGDESDWRPADERGVVVGLKAKGKARNDYESGFVVRTKAPSASGAA